MELEKVPREDIACDIEAVIAIVNSSPTLCRLECIGLVFGTALGFWIDRYVKRNEIIVVSLLVGLTKSIGSLSIYKQHLPFGCKSLIS